MTDKVKHLFTKKDLSEVERAQQEANAATEKLNREAIQSVINQQQELLDSGELQGLMFCGVAKNNALVYPVLCCTPNHNLQFNLLADYFKDTAYSECIGDMFLDEEI